MLDTIEYDYPAFHLSMDCFLCELAADHLELKEHEDAKWLTIEELDSVDWLPADVTLVDKIRVIKVPNRMETLRIFNYPYQAKIMNLLDKLFF